MNRAPATRLARKLGVLDAVVIGMGSMIGAGIFAALAPAARAAGAGLLVALAVAAFVAYCNATSSAELAALYPESGGTYVYGRKRLSPFAGFVAGFGFVVGKIASCAAMALTFADYAWPALSRPLAFVAVVAMTAINCFGIAKTALATRVIVAFVLACLALIVFAALAGGTVQASHLAPRALDAAGILQAAGVLVFAFAGYARIATLGEEVVDPARTIPRAIPLALGLTLAVYACVAVSAMLAVGAPALAASSAPLVTAIAAGDYAMLTPVVRIGASVASLGVLLSLLAGIGRTSFAMAANRDLPAWLAAVHPRYRVPHRAELVIGAIVAAIVLVSDVRSAIGFSSFAVLVYYGIANASAWTLAPNERRRPRWLAVAGVAGCAVLALSLPLASIVAGALVLAIGGLGYAFRWR
jgi:APA family basic amino acid/polyamine antiporter